MKTADLISLLDNAQGVSQLLAAGRGFGVEVVSPTMRITNNILSLGEIVREDLPSEKTDVPLGYEGDEGADPPHLIIEENFDINFHGCPMVFPNTPLILVEYLVFPKNEEGSPIVSIDAKVGIDSNGKIIFLPRTTASFHLQIRLPAKFEGSLNRMVVFRFELTEIFSLVAQRTTSFQLGLQIMGSVVKERFSRAVRPTDSISPKNLSVEASPFVPLSFLSYFDSPVRTASPRCRLGSRITLIALLSAAALVGASVWCSPSLT